MDKLFENSGWLLIDKLSKLFPGIIIVALIGRHLGPEEFGIWNYGIALTLILGSFAPLGLDKLAVKEILHNEHQQGTIVATIILMRIIASIVCMVASISIVLFTREHQRLYFYCTIFSALIIVLQSFDAVDYFYQARNNVKKVIIPKVSVFLVFCIVKLFIIFFNGTLIAFLWASIIELLLTYAIIMLLLGSYEKENFTLRVDPSLVKALLAKSWPLMLSNVVIVLFLKIDLIMLDLLSNATELGKYVGAARISELWYALPTVISIALLPNLIQKKKISRATYLLTLEKWLRLSFWLSLAIAMVVTLTARLVILSLYGESYLGASWMLMIHVWAVLPVFLSIVLVQYLFVEGAYKIYLYGNLCGLIVNLTLNFFLIPAYGGVGAALATVLAYLAYYITLLWLDKSGQGHVLSIKMFNPLLAVADFKQVQNNLRIFIIKLLHQPKTNVNEPH